MPVSYDTIKDRQNKKSHLLFSFLVKNVLFLHFIGGIYGQKYNPIFFLLHFNIYPLVKINVSIHGTNQHHRVVFVPRVISAAYRCVKRYAIFTRLKYATTLRSRGFARWATNFQNLLVSFCTTRYGEKQQKTLFYYFRFTSWEDLKFHPSVCADILGTRL